MPEEKNILDPIKPAIDAHSKGMEKLVASIPKETYEAFNRELIASGLRPECIRDLLPVTHHLGVWIGMNLRDGVPLNHAIAELDEVAGAPLETLLEACNTNAERVKVVMLKAAVAALALCCEPGRVVEAATFIIKTTATAVISPEELPREN